jgi:hypothetical protein
MSTAGADLKVVSLSEWWNDVSEMKRLPLLDLRGDEDYEKRRLCLEPSDGSFIVHVPLTSLKERSYELPPRHVTFALLIPDPDALPYLQELLLGADYSTFSSKRKGSRKPWKVPYGVLASADETWQLAKALGILQENIVDSSLTSVSNFVALPRLWQPDPMVEHVLFPILRDELQRHNTGSDVFEIWDLGAGSGRDVSFLAEELKAALPAPNFCVVGLDQRYRDMENEDCLRFWSRRGIRDVTDCRKMDFCDCDEVMKELEKACNKGKCAVKCFYAVRFWNRKLAERLAESTIVSPGTIFAISQFGKPFVDAPWNFEHPKVR